MIKKFQVSFRITWLLLLCLLPLSFGNCALPAQQNAQYVFLTPPDNFNPKISVVACFISVKDKFLFTKYQPHKSEGNKWGIPGGKLEKGEDAKMGILREIKEETGVDLSPSLLKERGKVYIRYPEIDFIYYMFSEELHEFPKIEIDSKEHSEYRWLTLQEALKLPLIRGEEECIRLVFGDSLLLSSSQR